MVLLHLEKGSEEEYAFVNVEESPTHLFMFTEERCFFFFPIHVEKNT